MGVTTTAPVPAAQNESQACECQGEQDKALDVVMSKTSSLTSASILPLTPRLAPGISKALTLQGVPIWVHLCPSVPNTVGLPVFLVMATVCLVKQSSMFMATVYLVKQTNMHFYSHQLNVNIFYNIFMFLLLELHVIRPLPSPRQVHSSIIQPWYGFSHVSPTTYEDAALLS